MFEIEKGVPLYIQLYTFIKEEIQKGNLKAGDKLPSKRKLSTHLRISQNTIETAYEQLQAEGYVQSKPRKGIFVNQLDEDLFHRNESVTLPSKEESLNQPISYKVDFSHGKTDLDGFPNSIWRKLTIQSLQDEENLLFFNGERQGELGLRKEIASYLFQSRGVRCLPEQIVIGAGTQYLLGLLTMLIGRGNVFSMEDPGFHRTRQVFQDQGVSIKPITLDKEGIHISHLKESGANVTYVTPSHQFPNGMVMPIARRMELLKWAEETEGYVIEDDYDGEFRYKGKPIPSLQGLDNKNRVIYLGTFSKSLIPSIRISYIILPNDLVEKYNCHFRLYKQTVSRLHQHTLYLFMKNGHWERHLNKMRTSYRRKHKALIDAIEKYLGDKAVIIGEESGLHILLKVKNGMTESEIIESAQSKKVKVYPTSVYYEEYDAKSVPHVLLGFGGLTEKEIEEGIMLLKDAWFS